MPQPTATIVDALSGDEVCPLCFDRFSAADACSCVVCRVSSCPSCAENLDADGAVRCFACRPPSQAPALAARASAPLSLPRPVVTKQAARSYTPGMGAARQPALPFPLTTSPQGVRVLQPKAPGSVFIGLPAIPAQLAQALRAPTQPAVQAKLAGRPLQKLLLLTRTISAVGALVALCQRALAKEQRKAWQVRVTAFARALAHHPELARARLRFETFARRAESALHALAQQGGEFAHWLVQHAEPRLRALSARVVRSKGASVVRVDPSRPIGS